MWISFPFQTDDCPEGYMPLRSNSLELISATSPFNDETAMASELASLPPGSLEVVPYPNGCNRRPWKAVPSLLLSLGLSHNWNLMFHGIFGHFISQRKWECPKMKTVYPFTIALSDLDLPRRNREIKYFINPRNQRH